MHFRFTLLLLLALFLLSAFPVRALDIPSCTTEATCDRNSADLEEFVKTFYTWYIVSVPENQSAWWAKPIQAVLKDTLTPSLLRKLGKIAEDTDADPILHAQD